MNLDELKAELDKLSPIKIAFVAQVALLVHEDAASNARYF